MKEVRIRSIGADGVSPWIYIQEKKESTPRNQPFSVKAVSVMQKRGQTNQYGRFRYSDLQYGKIEAQLASSLEISKVPMRIRNKKGEWIYFAQAEINGACPAIRIRSRKKTQEGPWVYIQYQEV